MKEVLISIRPEWCELIANSSGKAQTKSDY